MNKLYLLLCCALLSFNAAQAAINYTYIAQSFRDSTRSYNLDGNGGNDFSFSYSIPDGARIQCEGLDSYFAGEIVLTRPLGYDYGDSMGTFAWVDSAGTLANLFEKEQYVMVKLDNGTTAYYGWFRVSYRVDSLPGIVSMAFNDVPDQEIVPGQGDPNPIQTTGISEVNSGNYGFNMIGDNISFKDCSGYDKVCFYNTNGQQLGEITGPVEEQRYAISINGAVIVTFFKNGRVAACTKQYVK